MKNKFLKIIIIFVTLFLCSVTYSQEQFNFDITEIEILDEGNIFKGIKRGTVTTNNGVIIESNEFEYNKKKNILESRGKVEFNDTTKNITITTNEATYFRNIDQIQTFGNSKAITEKGTTISADNFLYDKVKNKINAYGNVVVINPIKNYKIFAEEITYLQNQEKLFSNGKTRAIINSQYIINSSDVIFLEKDNTLSSNLTTTINDQKSNFYYLEKFNFEITKEELKGEDVVVITNFGLPKSDKMFFSNLFLKFKEKKFTAGNTTILVDKNIFDNPKQDPRLKGISSQGNNNITIVKKGIFTSCSDKNKCPPWSIKSEEIIHDKNKKQIMYNNAILKIYDFPILYFPKFFHPDPSVKRQSGFLRPQLNESSILGTSFYLPYFKVLSENKDLTIRPTLFDSKIYMIQGEYRQENKNSSFIADLGYTKGYKSPLQNNKNSLLHIFANFNKNLELENFVTSNLTTSLQKVNNDTYLGVFDNSFSETLLASANKNVMSSSAKIILDSEDYSFDAGINVYENLKLKNSDRYTYVFPYYDFNRDFIFDNTNGVFNLSSSGNNTLQDTNKLKSQIINDLNFKSNDYISKTGFKNNYKFYFKNFNTMAKNDASYKNSPQMNIASIYEFSSTFPLAKKNEVTNNTITPQVSYRINPGKMNNQSSLNRRLNSSNIFDINRLGITDSFESGQSLTLGVNFKKESLIKDQSFNYTLATVLRDKVNNKIPESSTIDKKNSNIFGTFNNTLSENFLINYNFSIDNNLKKLHYNSINSTFSLNNFVTTFNFVEENSVVGDTNTISNSTSYEIDENNFITFQTRRNRKINLTEFYDLIYEYKNDCLTAGVKYRKTYYQDRELKPTENLLLTISLVPLTTYEHKVDR